MMMRMVPRDMTPILHVSAGWRSSSSSSANRPQCLKFRHAVARPSRLTDKHKEPMDEGTSAAIARSLSQLHPRTTSQDYILRLDPKATSQG